ncbi:MAG: hypothetical protein ACFB13_03120 [Kiloniellaceae bacterium]
MALLDSLIAFALTLAALATVVTIILEIAIRACGLKRKGQVALMNRLVGEVVTRHLPQKKSQWEVVKGILENPFSAAKMAADETQQGYLGTAAGGIYNEVSLEHVLRRVLETTEAAALLKQAEKDLKGRLQIIGNKYEEFSSALAADFKRSAQMWSIFVGIAVALAMNVDGVRLLTTYLQDPELRQSVIAKLPAPEEGQQKAASGKDEIDTYIDDLKTRLSDIGDLALPVGSDYFPHCLLFFAAPERANSPDPLCKGEDNAKRGVAGVTWLLKAVVTGILIGLGAPFWYDVARRLAAVRSAFGGKPAGEERYRGTDAQENAEVRDTLLDRVIDDAKAAVEGGGTLPTG